MLWTALSLLRWQSSTPAPDSSPHSPQRALGRFAAGVAGLVFVMALTGGLVAGTHAGLAYNTFPLMNGHLVPPEIMSIEPWYLNFVNNMATVQFDHRLIAWALAVAVPLLWWRIRTSDGSEPRARVAANLLLAALVMQVALGISTLLLVVPIPLAAAHQAGAVLLFAAALLTAHAVR
jgi:cytochrome c oxidase assembly protein subunit 15